MLTAVLSAHMGPYHWARARATAALAPETLFVEIASSQKLYPWTGYETAGVRVNHLCLFEETLEKIPQAVMVDKIIETLTKADPQVVFVPGYSEPYHRAAAKWARSRGRPAVLLSDSWEGDRPRIWLKEQAKKLMVQHLYSAAFVSGELAARYAVKLGIRPDRIWRGMDMVDNDHFAQGAERARRTAGRREELGLPQDYILCVARYIAEKNLPLLIDAYADCRRRGDPWHLVIVGDGPLHGQLKAHVAASGLTETVQVRSWATYDEMPDYYAFARYLVLPSRSETWGLVANEALAAGLPVVLSDRCGCAPELCRRGANGFVFNHAKKDELTEVMTRMSSGTVDLAAMGRISRLIISCRTTENWARTLLDCAATMDAGQKRR